MKTKKTTFLFELMGNGLFAGIFMAGVGMLAPGILFHVLLGIGFGAMLVI